MKHSFKKAIAILLVAASLTLIGTVSVFAAAPQPDASVQGSYTWNPKFNRYSSKTEYKSSLAHPDAECALTWKHTTFEMKTVVSVISPMKIKMGHANALLATANYGTGTQATVSEEAHSSVILGGGIIIDSGYTKWNNDINSLGKAICEGLMIYEGGGGDGWVITGTFS